MLISSVIKVIMQFTCIMRTNVYKEKILSLLRKKHFLTIAEIHTLLPEADHSTIFRNVDQLLKNKEVRKIMIDSRLVAYESVHENHDHFICNDCGKVEVVHVPVPASALGGRKVEDITVRGICAECEK